MTMQWGRSRTHPLKRNLEQIGTTVTPSMPAELFTLLKAEMENWGPIIRDAGIKPG